MTLWKAVDRWRYNYFEPDVDPEKIPGFKSLLEIWQSKRNGRRVPAWRDFDFYDFVGWHGKLSVYEVTYDPFDYKVRLSGTLVDEFFNRPMKGQTLQERQEEAIHFDDTLELCQMACTRLLITTTIGPLNVKEHDYKMVEFMELPLSDTGERATHTIEAFVPVK